MKNKKITAVLLVVAILVFAITAYAKPKEEASPWDAFEWTEVGEFSMEGNNLTPLKEIAEDCKEVSVRIDHFVSAEPVVFLFKLEFENRHIIAEKLVLPATEEGKDIVLTGSVKKGDRMRVFTQVFREDGEYVPDLECTLKFSYKLQ